MKTRVPDNYIDLLKEELSTRISKDSTYCQSRFAHDLSISRSHLSRLFLGSRPISEEMAASIALRLNWNVNKRKLFLKLVRLSRVKSLSQKQEILDEIASVTGKKVPFHALKDEQFKFISEWHHGAILEMIKMDNFQPDSRVIAKKLGLSPIKVEVALERLQLFNLIRKTPAGFEPANEHVFIEDIPSDAIRSFHKQHLSKALVAMDAADPSARNVCGITFAGDKSKIEEANAMIDRFNRELMAFMESGEKKDGLYHLTVGMIRLDKESLC